MSRVNRANSSRPTPVPAAPAAWRIRFVADPPPAARVIRQFTDPSPMSAIAEPVNPSDLPPASAWPEPTDQLLVAHIPNPVSLPQIDVDWVAAPANPDAPLAASLPLENGHLRWRPGRALITGKIGVADDVLAALAEFAFHEGQLRALEAELLPIEAGAQADVPRAFVVRSLDKSHWARLRETLERLASMRLTVARLEPRLYLRPRMLPAVARQIVSRLCARADVESRLEALNDRLEACEELYEGAVDRITDHRWYRKGMWVEIAIVVLLFLEVIQLSASLFFHLR